MINEKSLLNKESSNSNLNLHHITEIDYKYAKKACNIFNSNNTGDYHDLHAQSDTCPA